MSSAAGSIQSREELARNLLERTVDHEEQRRLEELEMKEREIRRLADIERERIALQMSGENGQGYSPAEVIDQQTALLEEYTQNAATRIQGHAPPGRPFAPPPGVSSLIPPITATTQQPPIPAVSALGGQTSSSLASMIASRDNLGNVMSILPPGRVRVSLEEETRRLKADQERKEHEMRRHF